MKGIVYLRVSALEKLLADLKEDHLDTVELWIENPDPDDSECTDCLFVSAVGPKEPDFVIDMDEIQSDDSLADLF